MKAYRDEKGRVTLFRPDMNMKRMNTTAERVALPVSVLRETYHMMGFDAGTRTCVDFQRRVRY